MVEIEIREIKPIYFLNGGQRGWKVLQYETINGERWLVGSRLFEVRMELSNTKGSLKENMKSRIHEIMKSNKQRREKSHGILKDLL